MEKSAIQILLRSSLFSYAATAVFLLLLAFGMYRFQWGEKEITLGVRGIYILACFLAGLSAGKKAKRRRFLWGFCAGALYFLIFLALSFAIRQSLKETASSLIDMREKAFSLIIVRVLHNMRAFVNFLIRNWH